MKKRICHVIFTQEIHPRMMTTIFIVTFWRRDLLDREIKIFKMETTIMNTDDVFEDVFTAEMGWTLFILCHFLVTSNLYFGLDMVDTGQNNLHNMHNYMDIPQFVAMTSLFIYFGVLSPSSEWINLYNETHPKTTLTNSCRMLATVLPLTSVLFSIVGILSVLSDYICVINDTKGEVDQDEWWLIVLYCLNILFMTVLSKAMGLWSPLLATNKIWSIVWQKVDDDGMKANDSRSNLLAPIG